MAGIIIRWYVIMDSAGELERAVGVSLVNCGPITIVSDSSQNQHPSIHPLLKTPAARQILASITAGTSNSAHPDRGHKQVSKVLVKAVSKTRDIHIKEY